MTAKLGKNCWKRGLIHFPVDATFNFNFDALLIQTLRWCYCIRYLFIICPPLPSPDFVVHLIKVQSRIRLEGYAN